MLERVKKAISEAQASELTFQEKFEQDIIETQDQNIDSEMTFLVRHHVTPLQLDKLAIEMYKGW